MSDKTYWINGENPRINLPGWSFRLDDEGAYFTAHVSSPENTLPSLHQAIADWAASEAIVLVEEGVAK